jgi:hypothetical protein
MSKKLTNKSVLVFVVVALLVISGTALAAPAEKVDICHLDEYGTYHLINVSGNAVPAHVAHGDGFPGGPVPGMPGYEFGEDCQPESAPILVVSSQLNFSGTGWGGWSCPPDHPNVINGGVSQTNTEPFVPPAYPVNQVAAVPGATLDGYTYPVFAHYTYGTGETGWVVHNGGTPQSLYIYLYCGE